MKDVENEFEKGMEVDGWVVFKENYMVYCKRVLLLYIYVKFICC